MGRLLAYARNTFLVYEPFNQDWGLFGVARKFPYLRGRVDAEASEARLLHRYLAVGDVPWRNPSGQLPHGTRAIVRRKLVQDHPGWSAVVKDPFMLCALGWSTEVLSRRPAIVTLRHPAAWTASMMRRQMSPEPMLRGLASQPELAEGHLAEILQPWHADQLRSYVERLALAWSAMVRMIDVQRSQGASIELVRMEDFGAAPEATVRRLYDVVGLPAPEDLDEKLRSHTQAETVVPDREVMHELRRNSAALATAWQAILSADQRQSVRDICEPHVEDHYSEW